MSGEQQDEPQSYVLLPDQETETRCAQWLGDLTHTSSILYACSGSEHFGHCLQSHFLWGFWFEVEFWETVRSSTFSLVKWQKGSPYGWCGVLMHTPQCMWSRIYDIWLNALRKCFPRTWNLATDSLSEGLGSWVKTPCSVGCLFRGSLKESEDLLPVLSALVGWCGCLYIGEMLQSGWEVPKTVTWSKSKNAGRGEAGRKQVRRRGRVRLPGLVRWVEAQRIGQMWGVGEQGGASQTLEFLPGMSAPVGGLIWFVHRWFLSAWHRVDAQ